MTVRRNAFDEFSSLARARYPQADFDFLISTLFSEPLSPHAQRLCLQLIELARSGHSLTNPVKKRPAWDVKLSGQFGWPPFIRQEPLMVPNPRAWRFHP